MGQQLGFFLNLDRCVQCHACEVACKAHNNLELGIKWRQVVGMWAGHYPDLVHRTLSYSCMHCGEPSCVDACPSEAIIKRTEDGIVLVDRDLCGGCAACAEACLYGAPQFGQDGIMQKCDLCVDRLAQGKQPVCVGTCVSEALHFGTLEELSKLARARQLEGSTRPSMLVLSVKWPLLERILPWK
jgi:anaerobic dimethyl sulfoxide reductase subunit B (iron-sulfur subunit)